MKIRTLGLMGVSTLALMVSGVPQAAFAAAAAPVVDEGGDTIIVTGTRDIGIKAIDSPTPISVIGSEALESTGANNVFDAMKNLLPSFSAAAQNFDSGEFIKAARLRGMNPGEVLVLVNGKRRHTSATVQADQSPDVTSNPTDLDMIPTSLIDHIEVLEAGAAAQYGSDGVINIILKNASSGTTVTAGGGITTRGDGAQGDGSFNRGFALDNGGMLNVSAEYVHTDFSNRNGINNRTINTPYPMRNRIEGQPLSDRVVGGFNFDQPVNADLDIYAFGTAGWRGAQAYENNRPSTKAPAYWPGGFFPRETLNEVDGAITGGVKGKTLGWDWDLSATYGQDYDHNGVINTVNTGMISAGLISPTGGTLQTYENSQTTVNFDVRKPFEIGLAGPLNVAAGLEFRHETFSIGAGDPGTYLYGGTQSESGATPSTAVDASRNVEAVYVDLSLKPISKLTIDLAGRFENFDQEGVGSTETGKLTARYDLIPELAFRGTVSDGFHAPTLAQSYFAVTNVTPNSLSLQAAPSSPGAQLLGAPALKPETSKDISFGIVAEPLPKLHFTADAYQVFLDHRIINSAQVSGPLALQAAVLNGNSFTGADAQAYVAFFNNGVDTRTRGVDLTADYKSDFGKFGTVKWSAGANVNTVAITNQYAVTAAMRAQGINSYVNQTVVTDLTKGNPTNKITAAANWKWRDFDVTLRETRYGHADENVGTSSAITPGANIFIKSAYITDIDIGYMITDTLRLNVGGNNVFDHMSSELPYALRGGRGSNLYASYTPWGIEGAYFYSRLSLSF